MGISWNKDFARDYAECWGDDWGSDVLSDDGHKWTLMNCDGESDGDAYMRLDGGTGSFATKRPDTPNLAYIDAESETVAGADLLGFLAGIVWPLGLIAGLVWGFAKGHTSFAYGMISSIVVLPLVLFGLCVIAFMVMIGAGGW
jgi:hypothetical protein